MPLNATKQTVTVLISGSTFAVFSGDTLAVIIRNDDKMKDKIILITGATGGIGKQTAISLAEKGATVIVTGRNKENGEKAIAEIKVKSKNPNIDLIIGDLSSISDIRQIAKQFKTKFQKLDVLINNAGNSLNDYKKTIDGLEHDFAVNVIAPFLLTNSLIDVLEKSNDPRVITLNGGVVPSKLKRDVLNSQDNFQGLITYCQSKLSMTILMFELAEQLKPRRISVNVCYPGHASTEGTKQINSKMLPLHLRFVYPIMWIYKFLTMPQTDKAHQKVARSSIFAASADELQNKSQLYIETNCKITKFPQPVYDLDNRKFIWNFVNNILKPYSNE